MSDLWVCARIGLLGKCVPELAFMAHSLPELAFMTHSLQELIFLVHGWDFWWMVRQNWQSGTTDLAHCVRFEINPRAYIRNISIF